MTHGGGGDRPRRRDINDELIEDAASKLGRDVEADRSEVAGVVEVVRSSCGEREEVVERELSCCGKVLAKELLSSGKKRSPLRTRTVDPHRPQGHRRSSNKSPWRSRRATLEG